VVAIADKRRPIGQPFLWDGVHVLGGEFSPRFLTETLPVVTFAPSPVAGVTTVAAVWMVFWAAVGWACGRRLGMLDTVVV
jgi:hypothetical protein